jgi:hypothetical protein
MIKWKKKKFALQNLIRHLALRVVSKKEIYINSQEPQKESAYFFWEALFEKKKKKEKKERKKEIALFSTKQDIILLTE